jgi:hypothetical protein
MSQLVRRACASLCVAIGAARLAGASSPPPPIGAPVSAGPDRRRLGATQTTTCRPTLIGAAGRRRPSGRHGKSGPVAVGRGQTNSEEGRRSLGYRLRSRSVALEFVGKLSFFFSRPSGRPARRQGSPAAFWCDGLLTAAVAAEQCQRQEQQARRGELGSRIGRLIAGASVLAPCRIDADLRLDVISATKVQRSIRRVACGDGGLSSAGRPICEPRPMMARSGAGGRPASRPVSAAAAGR